MRREKNKIVEKGKRKKLRREIKLKRERGPLRQYPRETLMWDTYMEGDYMGYVGRSFA